MKSAPKKRGRYHHGELRNALVTGAIQILEEKGFEALTLRSVGARVGVSHAAPVHHFPTKSDLLVAVAEEGFSALADALEEACATHDSNEEKLARVGIRYVRFALDHATHFRVMFGPDLSAVPSLPASFHLQSERAFAPLARLTGNERGVGDAALQAWAMVHGIALLWLGGPLRLRTTAASEAVLMAQVERVVRRNVAELANRRDRMDLAR